MDKIASINRQKTLDAGSALLKGGKELLDLAIRQGVKEGLKENDGLPQTSIQIIVRGIENIPIAIAVPGVACEDFLRRGQKVGGELSDEFGERGDFMQELGSPSEKQLAENTVETRDTLAVAILKILGIQRSEMRPGAEMPRVEEHGAEQAV
jgi:hypothetical protein